MIRKEYFSLSEIKYHMLNYSLYLKFLEYNFKIFIFCKAKYKRYKFFFIWNNKMVKISPQNVIDKKGNISADLLNKTDYEKLNEYLENSEDYVELSKAIKNSSGFQLWEDFLKEYNTPIK